MPTSKELKDLDSQLKKTVISAESFKRGSSFDLSKNFSSIHKNIGSLAGHTRKLVIRVGEIEKKVDNNSIKTLKFFKPRNMIHGYKISGTSVLNSPIPPPPLHILKLRVKSIEIGAVCDNVII